MTREASAPWRDEELLRQKYVGDDYSTRDLASKWGCDRKTISNWLHKFGIGTPTRPDNPPWQDKETLEYLYNDRGLTCGEIGERFGVSGRTVDEWRRRLDVTPLYKREEWLHEQYHENGLYISEIAEKADASRRTVTEWLDKLNVRTEADRPADYADEKPWHDRERLRELYHGEELSAERVADKMGCSPQTVRHWLIEFGIDRRPSSYRTIDPKDSRQNWYPQFKSSHNGVKQTVLAHRFIAFAAGKMTFEELCDSDTIIHHRTNLPWDNRPENLEVMSRSEHMTLHGQSDYQPEIV